jgi:hypothetical protein
MIFFVLCIAICLCHGIGLDNAVQLVWSRTLRSSDFLSYLVFCRKTI